MSQQLKELAQLATPWPWKWFTSNSHNRLSSVPSGKDGDVISAFKAVDGVACVSVSRADMAFIEAAHPGAVIELITSNEILSHEFEETKQLLRGTREKLTRAIDRNVAKDIEIKRLSAVERERDELKRNQELNLKIKQAMHERFTRAEAELARRDTAAGEPVAWISERNLANLGKQFSVTVKHEPVMVRPVPLYTAPHPSVVSDAAASEPIYQIKMGGAWFDVSEDTAKSQEQHGVKIRTIYTAAPPAVLPVVTDLAVELLTASLIDGADAKTALTMAIPSLGAQPQKPVVLARDLAVGEKAHQSHVDYAEGYNDRAQMDRAALDAADVKWVVK